MYPRNPFRIFKTLRSEIVFLKYITCFKKDERRRRKKEEEGRRKKEERSIWGK